jgi:hypothetical protein
MRGFPVAEFSWLTHSFLFAEQDNSEFAHQHWPMHLSLHNEKEPARAEDQDAITNAV